jgi:hypothetical protein
MYATCCLSSFYPLWWMIDDHVMVIDELFVDVLNIFNTSEL